MGSLSEGGDMFWFYLMLGAVFTISLCQAWLNRRDDTTVFLIAIGLAAIVSISFVLYFGITDPATRVSIFFTSAGCYSIGWACGRLAALVGIM